MRQIITSPGQVGEIFRGRRRARNLSQAELGDRLGISQARLSVLESDSSALTLERLIALANVLGLQLVLQDKVDKPPARGEW